MRPLIVVVCLSLSALCSAAQPEALPSSLTLSYVNHPAITGRFIPLIREAYRRLDIDVTFVEQPSARNLMFADKGIVDGDVAYSDLLFKEYTSLIPVGPSLTDVTFLLLCHGELPCNRELLFQAGETFVLTAASMDGMQRLYADVIRADLYTINHLSRIPELVSDGRFHYGIYVVTPQTSHLLDSLNVASVELHTTYTHHLLNIKHAALATRVAPILEQLLGQQSDPSGE
ncbi:hypothetical protein LJ739_18605 [Aestuariibacter halophilus]|uniref:Uncharacterized protein n=1 Tax=Fluctibacter halophilus TaxID=226011 RepID=A0ABS8GCJ8_9ALTE|nr:hypothetical protein [Aestuariibacter halophilus]MCC2618275.1 hypothetical protein [Aestuariibacter halophilus]